MICTFYRKWYSYRVVVQEFLLDVMLPPLVTDFSYSLCVHC